MAAEALTAAAIVMAEVAAETLAVASVRVRLVAEVIQAVVPVADSGASQLSA